MPKYFYKAKRGPEDFVEGDISAENKEEAMVKLESLGLIPIKVDEEKTKQSSAKEKEVIPERVRIKSKALDAFTWQLASLIKSNVPLLKALQLISQQTDNPVFRSIVEDFYHQVKNGKMVSSVMKKYPHIFNKLYVNMVKSGEEGGVLDQVLYKLAEYRERQDAIRRKVQAAMAYPAVMIVVGIGTVFMMLTFFMPKLVKIFETMKQDLPLPTQILIKTSHFMSEKWYWFVIVFALIYAGFDRMQKDNKKKVILDSLKLHLPVVKSFIRSAEVAKFCRTLGLLLKNGLSIYDALDLAVHTIENHVLMEPLLGVSKEIVNQGSTLSMSLQKTKIFPNFVINMIAVGEQGGRLEESLEEVAVAYEKEVNQGIVVMTSLIEPLLILFIGGIVGFIVFAMLLPVFDIGMGKG